MLWQEELLQSGSIRMFKLGSDQESYAVLFHNDYIEAIKKRCNSELKAVKKFIAVLLDKSQDISVGRSVLAELGFSDDDIRWAEILVFVHFFLICATGSTNYSRDLVQECLLTVKSANSYWFCFPGAGEFMKCYIRGRNAVLSTIRKSKYKQISRPVQS